MYRILVGKASEDIHLERKGERQILVLGKQKIDNLSSGILSRSFGHFSPCMHVKVFLFCHKAYRSHV